MQLAFAAEEKDRAEQAASDAQKAYEETKEVVKEVNNWTLPDGNIPGGGTGGTGGGTTGGGTTGGTTGGGTTIPDGDVPMSEMPDEMEIDEEAVPLAMFPDEMEIEDEAVPMGDVGDVIIDIVDDAAVLSDVPMTGDAPVIEFGTLVLLGGGALLAQLNAKKKENE